MPLITPPPDLVIFDCDGVLIDSERIAVEVDLIVLKRAGLSMTKQEVVRRFLGRSTSVMEAAIEAHQGKPLEPEVKAEFEQLYVEAFERDLEPVPGIVDALARLDRPTCVASSSTPESLYRKLTRVGLYDHFAGRIFSAVEVRSGKPAPDLFLFAAERMGADPRRCVVVEDSLYGVQAARAAGMRVLAFASELVDPQSLEGPDTTLFTDMAQLADLIEGRLQCSRPTER
jgi:HAD superfamily hydrolase (TIGR01509 family)